MEPVSLQGGAVDEINAKGTLFPAPVDVAEDLQFGLNSAHCGRQMHTVHVGFGL